MDVLVVDDEPALREVLSQRLESWGYRATTAADAREADQRLRERRPGLVLTDVVMPGLSGIDLLRYLKRYDPELPVILMTAHRNVDAAVEAMKEGAADFLTKPIEHESLKALVDGVAADRRRRTEDRALDVALRLEAVAPGLLGESAAMRTVHRQVAHLAASDASAILTGESGSGKEVAARAIHEASRRRAGPFVGINMAAIPEGLVEAEVFGHEAGAFTGATRDRAGCVELADGGTLFLDELAEMPIALQPKLLRVLEDGRVRRLGSDRERAFDVRVLAATNRRVDEALREGRLREDLYYRLNVFEVALPPLRDRTEDIPLLVRHFLHTFNTKHATEVEGVREPALARLRAWRWPGNVRELRNVIERAVVIARRGWIEPGHLPAHVKADPAGTALPLQLPPGATLAEAERLLVLATLERTGHNKAETARQLGLDVKTVRNKLRAWGVDP